jgi:subtilisin family serine protease
MRLAKSVLAACAVAVAALPAAPAAAGDAPDRSPTVLVRAASGEAADAIAARHGMTLTRAFAWIGWYELATPPGTPDAGAAQAALRADPDVQATDALARDEDVSLAFTPRDPVWSGGNLPTGEQLAWHLAKANFPAAWDRSTGAGASIGIIDSEFDIQHPELQPKVRNPYNTSSGTPQYHTGNVRAADTDSPSVLHGTHVAGIAAAVTDNSLGVTGAGFDATFVPVRINTSFTPGGGNPVDANFVGDLTERWATSPPRTSPW